MEANELKAVIELHGKWLRQEEGGQRANLSGADLSNANLRRISLCGATIDGAIVTPEHIGGPGHILCALTDDEWAWVSEKRVVAEATGLQNEGDSDGRKVVM